MFFKICLLKNFANFAEKYLCRSLFLTKLQVFRPAILSKRDFQQGRFPLIIAKFLRTPFLLKNPPVAACVNQIVQIGIV